MLAVKHNAGGFATFCALDSGAEASGGSISLHSAVEGQVWEFVRGILLDPAELRSGLDRAIELEREGRYGDPEAEAKHWLEKLSEIDEERRGFLRLAAKDRITDEELDEEL